MAFIKKYSSGTDLKNRIFKEYLNELNQEIKMYQDILNDKDWASTLCLEHIQVRKEYRVKMELLKTQVRILKTEKNK